MAPLDASESRPAGMLNSIQAMRGIAALMVLLYHAEFLVSEYFGGLSVKITGASGVDLFFVISGFIMVYTCYDRFGSHLHVLSFLRARAVRILPTYYLFTTITLVILLFFPWLYETLRFELSHVIQSYLLILSHNNAGLPGTLVGVGWTLVFEAYFYLLFAFLLFFPRKYLIPTLTFLFVVGVGLGNIFQIPYAWAIVMTNPLLFEFLGGCCIGMAYKRGMRLSYPVGTVAICLGAVWIFYAGYLDLFHYFLHPYRFLAFGVPSFLVIAGVVSLEGHPALRVPTILLRLGDSSYSLYLSHQYVLHTLKFLLFPLMISINLPAQVMTLVAMVFCIGCGFGCYYGFEKPVNVWLRRRAEWKFMGLRAKLRRAV